MLNNVKSLPQSEECDFNPITTSDFYENYKYTYRDMQYTLEIRRHEFLEKQRERRQNAFDEKRDLLQLFSDDISEEMETELLYKPKRIKKIPFGYKLMGSIWLTVLPDDFFDKWLIKFCPEGTRYLVVAHKALTTCYYQNGRPSMKFKSKLPGGSPETAHKFTLLDCVYNKTVNKFFVYDVLAWNSLSLLNAEAYMRFCWLKTKFEENPEMLEINPQKNFGFIVSEFFPADISPIRDKLLTQPLAIGDKIIPYDGVLFYHKEGCYIFGRSPLVGWLKTFMITEIFQVQVHPMNLVRTPQNYNCIDQFLSLKKSKKKTLDSVEMVEIEEVECSRD